ncbi:MAG: DegT/DnrJ/EryC1/StrS family aminotransferase [Oscillospiraceae bacterium]|nr:DegT/DnrJ/EryC1/StrS family aminotransferase [Oscillospiraceae bacterium]
MQFRDLKSQYQKLKNPIDKAIAEVLEDGNYISGKKVKILEEELASYVGVKHCITCANGTDALTLAMRALNISDGDGVFVPDFTFFATAETVALEGAVPVFVDINLDTYNISPSSLEENICRVIKEGKVTPKAIVAVDLYGLPADYEKIKEIAEKHNLFIIEDGAQGFGGMINNRRACSFGDISTTSFFPAKPLGCYGDGGAIFTDNDDYAGIIRSLCVHGKGEDKYHNVRIGYNSRLDTLQAAVLCEKLKAFSEYEVSDVNKAADIYNKNLTDDVIKPLIPDGFYSSYAQYTIRLENEEERASLQNYLKENNIPSMVYYPVPMHKQTAFSEECNYFEKPLINSEKACETVLSLPIGPYISESDQIFICKKINEFMKEKKHS